MAHPRNERLFVKMFDHVARATYPDLGSSVETFTDGRMLELETLSPITRVEPGCAVEHVEHWFLWRDVPTPRTDDDVDRDILPKVTSPQVQAQVRRWPPAEAAAKRSKPRTHTPGNPETTTA